MVLDQTMGRGQAVSVKDQCMQTNTSQRQARSMLMVVVAILDYTGVKKQHPSSIPELSMQLCTSHGQISDRAFTHAIGGSLGIMLRQGSLRLTDRLRGLVCQGSLSCHASAALPQAVQLPETEAACPFSTSAAAGKPRVQEQAPPHEWGQARAPWTPTSELAKRKTLTKRMGYMMQVGRKAAAFQAAGTGAPLRIGTSLCDANTGGWPLQVLEQEQQEAADTAKSFPEFGAGDELEVVLVSPVHCQCFWMMQCNLPVCGLPEQPWQ